MAKVSIKVNARAAARSVTNFDPAVVLREAGGGPSKTVPNKALSVQTILQKFSSGQALPSVLDMDYTGDSTTPDLRTLDLVERANLHRYLKDHIAKVDKEYKEKLQLRRDAAVAERERYNAALAYMEQHMQGKTDDKAK